MTAPRIVVAGFARTLQGRERAGTDASYARALARAGALPLILAPVTDPAWAADLLPLADGLLLTGGHDLDPARYGAHPSPALETVDPARDALDLALFGTAWDRRLPVLAVCRGLQVVNVALGGTLWQDLPSERPGPVVHNQGEPRANRSHPITIAPGSRLRQIAGAEEVRVNSFHHQAVRDIAPGLRVTATAEDGVIEGLESDDLGRWLVAVQWHPEEFHASPDSADQRLFEALVEAARAAAAEPA